MAGSEQRLLLLVGDDPAQTRAITVPADRRRWRTQAVRGGTEALTLLGTRRGADVDAVILDHSAAGVEDAPPLIAAIRAQRPRMPIVVLTPSASPLPAVAAMRAGASDYLIKPVAPDRLMQSLDAACQAGAARDELTPLTEKLPAPADFAAIVGSAPLFRAAVTVAANAARGHGRILVEGERGTGKEMLLRAVHAAGPRAQAPLTIVNVGASPANALGSLLFGHEKGAFAGAFERQVGVLRQCAGATLVIDEVDLLPAEVQHLLLAAITSGEIRPIGSRAAYPLEARLLFASDEPLRGLCAEGRFLPALREAMAPVAVSLSPLRMRGADVAALTHEFLARIAQQPGLRSIGIDEPALALLGAYTWPGNVRQLQAVLFRAAVFCDEETLGLADFPQLCALIGTGASNGRGADTPAVSLYRPDGHLRTLEEIESDIIRLAVGVYRGRMTEVARRLGIGRSTLYRKLGEMQIDAAA